MSLSTATVCIPMRQSLVAQFILRSEGRHDVPGMMEDILEDFLLRTKGDPHIWSDAHANSVAHETADDTLAKFGSPGKGYRWQGLLLEDGSQLKMPYGGKDHFAEVRHQQIYYEGSPCSPSQFASRVANNTSRNAWRDIWVKGPSDQEFRLADNLRRASDAGGSGAVMALATSYAREVVRGAMKTRGLLDQDEWSASQISVAAKALLDVQGEDGRIIQAARERVEAEHQAAKNSVAEGGDAHGVPDAARTEKEPS